MAGLLGMDDETLAIIGGLLSRGAIGRGINGYLDHKQRSAQLEQLNAYRQSQIDENLNQADDRRRKQNRLETFTAGLEPPDPTPTGPTPMPTPPLPPGAPAGLYKQLRDIGVPEVAIRTATMSNDPVAAVQKLVEEFSKPVFGQSKIPLVRQNDTFKAVMPEGMTDALAAQTGAEEGAKAQYEFIDVPQSDGTTRKMSKADAMRTLSQGQPPQSQPPAAGNRNQVILDLNLSDEQALKALRDARMAQQKPTLGVSMGPVQQHAQTAAIDTTQQGVRGLNEDFVKNTYRPAITAEELSRRNNAQLDLLERLPILERTGWGTKAMAYGANFLAGIGIPFDKAKELASDAQKFNSAVYEHNWTLLQQQKGVQTEGDSQRALKTWAQLENTPQANQYLIDWSRANNNLAIKKSKFFRDRMGQAQKSGDYSAIEREWYDSAPSLWDDPAMKKWSSTPAATGTPTISEVRKEMKRRLEKGN